ncbi:hypothetical protein Vi05172_g387 [Venturia inaequalis]|nr:hypothetical protein Vi05172_g387 [Venturia inaequalis]
MKIPTALLFIGTATALVPRQPGTSGVGNSVFAKRACAKWGEYCPPTGSQNCCPDLKCKQELVPGLEHSYQNICRIH